MKLLNRLCLLVVVCALVGGCASSLTPVADCCYAGPLTTARLGDVPITLDDGSTTRFQAVFPGFAPQPGAFTRPLPFNHVLRADIVYATLVPLLPLYDANGDGQLEQPEVLVLFAREAALATGTPVRHLGADDPVRALSTANADIGGLVAWVDTNRSRMNEQGQAIFRDLEQLGRDLRVRGSEGGMTGDNGIQIF